MSYHYCDEKGRWVPDSPTPSHEERAYAAMIGRTEALLFASVCYTNGLQTSVSDQSCARYYRACSMMERWDEFLGYEPEN
jgi:hypothetical protein